MRFVPFALASSSMSSIFSQFHGTVCKDVRVITRELAWNCALFNLYLLSPGQTIGTSHCNISQHCWPGICKLRPNERNSWTQQNATLLCATFWKRLATQLQSVAKCCEFKIELVRTPRRNFVARTWPNDYNIVQHPQMLHEKFDHFQIWANNTQHVATRRNRVAKRSQHVAHNNVVTCCVEIVWLGLNVVKETEWL